MMHVTSLGSIEKDSVNVTPAPVLARFERLHDGMAGLVEVLRGVLILRRVAAANMTTLEA